MNKLKSNAQKFNFFSLNKSKERNISRRKKDHIEKKDRFTRSWKNVAGPGTIPVSVKRKRGDRGKRRDRDKRRDRGGIRRVKREVFTGAA